MKKNNSKHASITLVCYTVLDHSIAASHHLPYSTSHVNRHNVIYAVAVIAQNTTGVAQNGSHTMELGAHPWVS